jgi:hypothetical protein
LPAEILESARKHGLSDDRILHAYRNPMWVVEFDEIRMLIGADQAGRLLEVGVTRSGGIDYIMHAMPARPRFMR